MNGRVVVKPLGITFKSRTTMRQMIRHNLIRFNYVALLALLGGLLLPLCASAANYDFEYDGLYYKVTGANTVSVFHYPNGNSSALPSELTIPETVENAGMTYTVTEVANEAFRYRNTLKSVHLPSSIKAIGHSAFCECTALTSIDLPEGITKVGALCFAQCTALTSIDIPEGTTEVGAHCFSGCTALTHIKLPGTLTEISESLFDSCRSLTSVELSPSSVSAVGASAFRWCVNLQSRDDDISGLQQPVVACDSGIGDHDWRVCFQWLQPVAGRAHAVGVGHRRKSILQLHPTGRD